MSKLQLTQGVPGQYDQQYFYRLVSAIEVQLNGYSEGRMAQRYQARAAIPTTGAYAVGDIVWNSTPVETAGTGHTYAILGWQCTVAGTPGTLEEMRYLTSDITGGAASGTVVTLVMPTAVFDVAGNNTATITVTFDNQSANTFFAGPTSGGATTPAFRAFHVNDLANDIVTYAKIQNVTATNKGLGRVSSGAGDIEEYDLTAAGRALLDDADAAAQRTTLGIVQWLQFAIGDETTAITTGTAKLTTRFPACTVLAVRASLTTQSSSGNPTVDINESGTTILSTKLSIDSGEKTSTTAATAAVISDSTIADDAEITFDIDTAGTGAAGLKVSIQVRWTN